MNNSYSLFTVGMGVGIFSCWKAMSCPSNMCYSYISRNIGQFQPFLDIIYFTFAFFDV